MHGIVHLLNQPHVKQLVKDVTSPITFVIGLTEIYDIYQMVQHAEVATENYVDSPAWMQQAHKVTMVSSKISLVLSATVSYPGAFVISKLVGSVFSGEQLTRMFGINATFAMNPWHPRHVVSITAFVLAQPAVIESTCHAAYWVYKKIRHIPSTPSADSQNLTADNKVRMMILFNTLTSRTTLHLGNLAAHLFFRT